MNRADLQSETVVRSASSSMADTRLRGYWLVFARVVWIAVVVLILTVFVASIPAFNALLQNACTTAACDALIPPYSMKQYQAAGISITFVLIYSYALTVFALLAFLAIGAVIFWLKSQEFMAFYTSFALVTFAMTFNSGSLLGLVPAWWLPIHIISFLGSVAFGTFLYLFPNGRFVPRWMRWLVGGWVIYSGVVYFFPDSWLNNFWSTDFLFAGLLVSLLVAQVYRYRQVSSQVERQQTKWVVFGMSICVIGLVLVNFLYFSNPLSLFHAGPLSDLMVGTVLQVFVLLIPLSIALAILRSRLWDIDIIINRTVVYGILTALLALVYFGSVIGLQFLLHGFTGGNQFALVGSTLLIAALFQPLRHRIQTMIDRRFYRRKYDAARTLAAFSATLRSEVDLSQIREDLMAVVQEAMQPAHISLWFPHQAPFRQRNTRMLPYIDEEERRFP
jgi:hypothetical protein